MGDRNDLFKSKPLKNRREDYEANRTYSRQNQQQQYRANMFDGLDDDVEDVESPQRNQRRPPKATKGPGKISSPPPITIVGSTLNDIQIITSTNNFENYSLKMTTEGIKIFTNDHESYQKLKSLLVTSEIQFYGHRLREEQLAKFVLHGLHKMKNEEILESLAKENIKPFQIKPINIKNKKFDEHTIYIVYFLKKDKIKLSTLREIKVVNFMRVNWDFYRYKRQGPTQCANCQAYGHGTQNCHLKSRCIRCAGEHKSASCPLINGNKENKIPNNKLKCALCGQNHTANYSKCEVRSQFVYKKSQQSSAYGKQNTQRQQIAQRQQTFKPAPELSNFNFPGLPKNQPRQNPSSWNRQQASEPQASEDLFTFEQMIPILTEMMTKMSRAKTRQEQIHNMMSLVLKYCSPITNGC